MTVLWELERRSDSEGSAVFICFQLQECELTEVFMFSFFINDLTVEDSHQQR